MSCNVLSIFLDRAVDVVVLIKQQKKHKQQSTRLTGKYVYHIHFSLNVILSGLHTHPVTIRTCCDPESSNLILVGGGTTSVFAPVRIPSHTAVFFFFSLRIFSMTMLFNLK